jgi:hypothetical protein
MMGIWSLETHWARGSLRGPWILVPKGRRLKAKGRPPRAHPGKRGANNRINPEGVASIPNVPFVPLKTVLSEQPPKLVLKRFLSVMRFLILDIFDEPLNMTWTDGEGTVTRLPVEVAETRRPVFDPDRRRSIDLFDEIGDGRLSPKSAEDVNMVGDAADAQHWAVESSASATKKTVHLVAKRHVSEKRLSILR